jgi:hypothetical protein
VAGRAMADSRDWLFGAQGNLKYFPKKLFFPLNAKKVNFFKNFLKNS